MTWGKLLSLVTLVTPTQPCDLGNAHQPRDARDTLSVCHSLFVFLCLFFSVYLSLFVVLCVSFSVFLSLFVCFCFSFLLGEGIPKYNLFDTTRTHEVQIMLRNIRGYIVENPLYHSHLDRKT